MIAIRSIQWFIILLLLCLLNIYYIFNIYIYIYRKRYIFKIIKKNLFIFTIFSLSLCLSLFCLFWFKNRKKEYKLKTKWKEKKTCVSSLFINIYTHKYVFNESIYLFIYLWSFLNYNRLNLVKKKKNNIIFTWLYLVSNQIKS